VRPLHAVQRRRAAVASVLGHCALLTSLALLGARSPQPSSLESTLILAELVTAAPEPAPVAAIASEEPAPERAIEEPVPQVEREPAAAEAELEPRRAPPPAPRAEQPPEPSIEPPAEPPPAQRLADAPEPLPEPAPELLEPEPEPAQLAAESPPAPTPPSAAQRESRSLASHEQRAVSRRLSSWTGRFSADEPTSTLVWRDDGQEYTAVLKPVPASDAMGMEQLLVELTTERDGRRLATELRMNRIAFSNFAQFIDRWDPNVQIHDDLIDGRFHSNTEIRVSRDRGVQPVFNGKVTVAGADIRTEGIGFVNRRQMFPAGIETRVRRIGLPPRAAAFDDGAVPAERVRRIVATALLTFHADGSFESRPLAGGGAAERGALGEEPLYLVAEDGASLHVRGVVNGKVLVYSPEHIVIDDDIRYLADPRTPGADDYLGLVAERSVEIGEPDKTGPGDLEVHASIYARNRFAVRAARSRRSGTLIVYGSVTAGSVSATEPRYATRIEFDDRLTTMRAPGFPLSDRYELDAAAGEWRVVDEE
jgi:hypothetical protein